MTDKAWPTLIAAVLRALVAVAVSVGARVPHLRRVEIPDADGAQRCGADRTLRERA
jgi:hypothetical protein